MNMNGKMIFKIKEKIISENLIICAMQIFSYNMISIVVIMFGSLFECKKEGEKQNISFNAFVPNYEVATAFEAALQTGG